MLAMTNSTQTQAPNGIWDDDLLGRKTEGEDLLYFLEKRYEKKGTEDGFVLAVNGKWGAGKSFFVERVCKEAEKRRHPTFIFNAWENDFTKDPLLAFISEFNTSLSAYFERIPIGTNAKRQVKDLIEKCWKPALKIVGFALAKQIAGVSPSQLIAMFSDNEEDDGNTEASENGTAEIKDVAGKLNDLIKNALQEHQTIKDSIKIFKIRVGQLIRALDSIHEIDLPILIFVDELDRCRPDYAIELLEGIKHLFGVPGLYFVVATNIEQLSHSVKAVYGSEFDGQTYLKRFFDLQYSLSNPSTKQFCNALATKMALPDISKVVYGLQHVFGTKDVLLVAHNVTDVVAYVLELHAAAFDLTLRDQLQVSVIVDAALDRFEEKPVHIFFLVFLAVIYHKDPGVYSTIVQARHLEKASRFREVYPANDQGMVSFRSDLQSSNSTQIALDRIAKEYFETMSLNENSWNSGLSHLNIRTGFPKNMIFTDCVSQGKSFPGVDEFEFYFDVVRRAGGFSSLTRE